MNDDGHRIGTWRDRLREVGREVDALLLACRDERTPWYAKLAAFAVLAYAVSPIDLIPDFIPVLGLLDDMLLVPLGVIAVGRLIPAEVLTECRTRAGANAASRPFRLAGGAAVLLIWGVLTYFGFRLVRHWL